MDKHFMRVALEEAKKALAINEVPIGAVIVYGNEIIATGYNQRETSQLSLSHAELIAIEKANQKLGTWRLEDCTLYVTLEPCQMCAGAIVQSRIKRVVFGALDGKAGCAGSILNILEEPRFNHQVELTSGVLQEECSMILTQFFQELRSKRKNQKKKRQSDELQ